MKCAACGGTIKKPKGADPDDAWRARLALAFPDLDIEGEMAKGRRWIILHPGRVMTRLFVEKWLTRAANDLKAARPVENLWQGITVGDPEAERRELDALRSRKKA